ncbi:MAG: hypothetical protein WCG20_04105 [bacterium]
MKNTQLAIMFAIISMLGIHSRASAQILPVNGSTLINSHVIAATTVQTAAPITVHTINPAIIAAAPIAVAVTPTLQVYNANPINVGTLHGIDATLTPVAVANTHTLSGTSLHVSAQSINTAAIAHANIGLAVNDPGTGNPSNTGGTSGSNQNSGSSGSNSSSGGTTVGRYPVVTVTAPAPIVVDNARPAVYTETYKAAPKKVVEKQIIPLLPEDSVDMYPYHDTNNNMSASVQGISGQMTLVGILIAIAAVLGLMVAAKEYQMRKQMKQYAHYA